MASTLEKLFSENVIARSILHDISEQAMGYHAKYDAAIQKKHRYLDCRVALFLRYRCAITLLAMTFYTFDSVSICNDGPRENVLLVDFNALQHYSQKPNQSHFTLIIMPYNVQKKYYLGNFWYFFCNSI